MNTTYIPSFALQENMVSLKDSTGNTVSIPRIITVSSIDVSESCRDCTAENWQKVAMPWRPKHVDSVAQRCIMSKA